LIATISLSRSDSTPVDPSGHSPFPAHHSIAGYDSLETQKRLRLDCQKKKQATVPVNFSGYTKNKYFGDEE